MFEIGEIISHPEMCKEEGVNLQRGMNYQLGKSYSVILMSLRRGAPYADKIEEDGKVLIYEGHNVSRSKGGLDPKTIDQPMTNPSGSLTQNGLFFESAIAFINEREDPELVRVYEKIQSGIWTFNGLFNLINAWQEQCGSRNVFKFRLELLEDQTVEKQVKKSSNLDHERIIPASVKLQVWKRDKGQCQHPGCGSKDNLHFDHIIPYSKGGSSLVAKNIQLLCARHNLEKHDKIQ